MIGSKRLRRGSRQGGNLPIRAYELGTRGRKEADLSRHGDVDQIEDKSRQGTVQQQKR